MWTLMSVYSCSVGPIQISLVLNLTLPKSLQISSYQMDKQIREGGSGTFVFPLLMWMTIKSWKTIPCDASLVALSLDPPQALLLYHSFKSSSRDIFFNIFSINKNELEGLNIKPINNKNKNLGQKKKNQHQQQKQIFPSFPSPLRYKHGFPFASSSSI